MHDFVSTENAGLHLPAGLIHRKLHAHLDDRGIFCEFHRASWVEGFTPVQWNAVRSRAGVFRGVHAHRRHRDLLTVVDGTMILGVRDLRRASPTYGLASLIELDAERPEVVLIPTGVAHGFAFPVASIHVYAVDVYWDGTDQLSCRWDDAALGLKWPLENPVLSPKDQAAGSLADLERDWNGG